VGGGGGEAGVWTWFGDCGGLEKDGSGGGCWLKCSGGSTLALMAAGLSWESACESGKGRLSITASSWRKVSRNVSVDAFAGKIGYLDQASHLSSVAVRSVVLRGLYRPPQSVSVGYR
jgi:hypothetical protein